MTEQHRSVHLSEGPGSGQPVFDLSGAGRAWFLLAIGMALHMAAVHLAPRAGGAPGLWRNALVVVALPSLLAFLASRIHGRTVLPRPLAASWIGLFAVAAVGLCWSPYPRAALETLAYLWAWGCLFVVLRVLQAWRSDATSWLAAWAAGAGLIAATVQTVAFGNPFGGWLYRFTSFAAPQVYGLSLALLVALLLIGVRRDRLPLPIAAPLAGALVVASQMNGGRQGFVATALIVVLSTLPFGALRWRQALVLPAAVLAVAVAFSLLVRVAAPAPMRTLLEVNDVVSLLTFSERSLAESGDAGTTRDRLKIWKALGARLSASSPAEWAFGHGTASSGLVIAEGDVRYRGYTAETMDPNRTAHNEFLRSLFEWGVAGLVVIAAVVLLPILHAAGRLYRDRQNADLILLAAAGIGIPAYALLGNTLVASGGPLGTAIVLLMAEVYGDCVEARGASRA